MKNKNHNNSSFSCGVGFTGALTIALIVLKLCKVINWSWLLVLSPIWISAGLAIVISIFMLIIFAMFVSILNNKDK